MATTSPSGSEAAPVAVLDDRRGDEARHADATRAMFDRLAPRYDLVNRVTSAGVDVRWRKAAVGALGSLPPGDLLDLCAGTLDVSAMLERAYPDRQITAADFSPQMLARGRARGITERTRTVVADASQLPFGDASFAGILVAFGIRNVGSPETALREMCRVLKPGGRAVVLEFFKPERAVTRAFHSVYATAILPAIGKLLSGDASAYRYLVSSMEGFYAQTAFETAMSNAGFARVQGRPLLLGIASIVVGEVAR